MRPTSKTADALRDAEARARALAREVGSLREELRRENKKKERAVDKAQGCEETQKEALQLVNELRYTNQKLSQQLASTQVRLMSLLVILAVGPYLVVI